MKFSKALAIVLDLAGKVAVEGQSTEDELEAYYKLHAEFDELVSLVEQNENWLTVRGDDGILRVVAK